MGVYMLIKHRMAAAGSAALMAAALVAGVSAVPAFATTYNPGYICSDSGFNNCLLTHGSGNTVTVPVQGSHTTNFSQKSEGTWQGHPMVEYMQVGTNLCLQWEYKNGSGTVVNVVRMATCNAGAAELWYINDNDMIVNKDYPGYYGTQGCMEAPGDIDLYVESCNVTVEDQMFFYNSK